MPPEVEIKGIREGLLVSLGDGEWSELEQTLFDEIEARGDFIKGAQLILDVDQHEVGAAAMTRLRRKLADQGLSLWAVLSQSAATQRNAQALGLATRIHRATAHEAADNAQVEVAADAGVLVKRTLRSGADITHPGHVTVIGDVNPGAQIIAGGNVVVWGRLRGMVHAGAGGDESAVVCAMDLAPTQLRIAGHIAIAPKDGGQTGPEMAMVRDRQVVAEPWAPSKVAA